MKPCIFGLQLTMTNYRQVVRTTKGGTIKLHAELDWVYYAAVSVNKIWYSTTTRTLEEAEEWIAKTKAENKQPRKPYPKRQYRQNHYDAEEYYYSFNNYLN